MGRVRAGSIVVEAYELNSRELRSLFNGLRGFGYELVEVVVSPSSFYGKRASAGSAYQYVAGPLSIVLCDPSEELVEFLLESERIKTFFVERDAWIDTRKLNLSEYLRALSLVEEATSSCTADTKTAEIGGKLLSINCLNLECSGIIYVDYVNAPHEWAAGLAGVENSGECLRRALEGAASRRPVEYVLSYMECAGERVPLLVYRPSSSGTSISYTVSPRCRDIYEYLEWSLIDVLLK